MFLEGRVDWFKGHGRLWQVKNVKSRRMLAMTLCKWAEVEKLQRWGDRMKKLDAVASYLASRPPPGPGAHGKPGSIITKYSQPSLRQSVSTSGYMYTDLNVLVWSVSLFIYICWRACRTSTLEVGFPFGAFNLQCAPDSASSGEMAEEWSVGNHPASDAQV